MMVNANLMLMVVFLWAGTLPVASPKNYPFMLKRQTPDCEKYVLPINAMWEPTCDENKRYKCKKGYESIVQTTCENGGWILEPACEAVGCPQGEIITLSDDVTESSIVGGLFHFSCSVGFVETGTLRCEENGTWTEQKACQVVLKAVVNGNKMDERYRINNCTEECATTPKCGYTPGVHGICDLYRKPVIFIYYNTARVSECIQKCKDEPRCLTIFYESLLEKCYLYNTDFTTITNTDGLAVVNDEPGAIVEKSGFDFVNTP
ncbi:hypothetical protein LOTGIDRAFT_238590 [Lottia gigantea]|uniref:Sushi domain-containing protein n=1 Tax=Lottia gigantea TaxID=225164 RepID=V4ASX7_LOTGI|nr:hypothetical protein LOTGIDRAFT_238590 [Lottia gigantea]ESP00353.1 hypothetical protein LOTGIDRAFT_238590 [Lottia gigantea]